MTEIERKALALAIEVRADDKYRVCKEPTVYFGLWEALCRAIERHEAFRKEVSNAVEHFKRCYPGYQHASLFDRFIIAKPDPLVEAVNEVVYAQPNGDIDEVRMASELRAALAKRGLEIREKE